MSHLGKTCTSEMKTNHNLEVMLEIYEYDPIEQLYKMQGRTGLLKAYNLLITKINEEITLHNELKAISFDHTKVAGLKGYVPFYADEARLSETVVDPEEQDEVSDNANLYIVDEVIQKRFHPQKNQYEFLVTWIGYTDQTWELPNNIPSRKIAEFENKVVQQDQSKRTLPYSLRSVRKKKIKMDYIKTF